MIPPSTYRAFAVATSLLLLFAGEWAMWYFLQGDLYLSWYMGGYAFLILMFYSMKLYLVKTLTKGGTSSTPKEE
jgi:hypothetical protein